MYITKIIFVGTMHNILIFENKIYEINFTSCFSKISPTPLYGKFTYVFMYNHHACWHANLLLTRVCFVVDIQVIDDVLVSGPLEIHCSVNTPNMVDMV